MKKLTEVQRRVLAAVAERDGWLNPWAMGTRTCEALRKRGLVEEEKPFVGVAGYYPRTLRITEAGRAALKDKTDD